jgi:hypothetical protein
MSDLGRPAWDLAALPQARLSAGQTLPRRGARLPQDKLRLLPESVQLWFVALMESKREGLSFDEAMARLEGSWPEKGYLEWRMAIGQPVTPPDA